MHNLTRLTDKQLDIASRRLAWIMRWNESGIANAQHFVAAASEHGEAPPSYQSLYRYKSAYARGGLAALAPQWKLKGEPGTFGNASGTATEAAARASLDEQVKLQLQAAWLRQSKPSMRDAVRTAEINCGYGISYHAARRFLLGLDKALVTAMREGQKALNDKWLPYVMQDYTRYESGQRYVMDHHTFDAVVRDFRGRLFRPYLTICTDFRSRKPLGWCVCECPNGFSIARALCMAVQQYGVPEEILIDNGKDFNSALFRGKDAPVRMVRNDGMPEQDFIRISGVFDSMGVRVINTTPYRGQSKNVERFFRDVATQFAKWLPTYVGSNTVTRPEESRLLYRAINSQAKRETSLTLHDVDAAMGAWLTWRAATHQHGGMGMDGKTPDEVFAARTTVRPVSEDAMRVLFARTEIRAVRREGVHVDAWYWSDELIGLQGEKVQVRRPLNDVSYVWICDLHGRSICKAYADVFVGGTEEALSRARSAGKKLRRRVREAERVIREAQHSQITPIEHAQEWARRQAAGQEHAATGTHGAEHSDAQVIDLRRELALRKIGEENVRAEGSSYGSQKPAPGRKGLFE